MYAKSLNLPGLEFSSSGIVATQVYDKDDISPLAVYVAKQHKLDLRDSSTCQLTTHKLLHAADLVIFMHSDIYHDAAKLLTFHGLKAQSWRIRDWDEIARKHHFSMTDTAVQHEIAEDAFHKIKAQVDKLVHEVTTLSWVDIVDVDNVRLNVRLPISWANATSQGWHRGCHAIITTPSGVIVEKRSDNIVFSPGLLDISVGGAVDSGETPKTAILREIKEELGLIVAPSRARLIEVRRWSTYHPRFKKYTRTHLYSYHVHLDHEPILRVQSSELASVQVVSLPQVRSLLRRHRLKGLGRLNYAYKYYDKMLKLAFEKS